MEGHKCHISYRGLANFLLDRIIESHDRIRRTRNTKKNQEAISKMYNDIEVCRKQLMDLIPDNDKEECS